MDFAGLLKKKVLTLLTGTASALTCALASGAEAAIPAVEWSVDIRDGCDSSAAIASDGTIYFGTFKGKLWALTSGGVRKWTFQAEREIRSSPAIAADGTIYFGSRDRKLYAVGPEGKLRWRFQTGAWVDASPAIASDGTVYCGSWDKSCYAVSPEGSKKWEFSTGGPVVSSAAVDFQGRIFFGSHDGRFYALDPAGKKVWDFRTGGPIISSPALDRDGTLYFTSVDGCLYALNPDSTLKWKLKTGGVTASSPVIGLDGDILVGVNTTIWAVGLDGKKKLERQVTYDFPQPVESTPVALADGSVCAISGLGWLRDMTIGKDEGASTLWLHYLWAHGFSSPTVSQHGSIYLDGQFTNFYALKTTVPLAKTPWPKFRADPQNTGRLLSAPQ